MCAVHSPGRAVKKPGACAQLYTCAERENEVGVSGSGVIFLAFFSSKLEVQSLQLRLNDHETESAEAEGLRS